MFIELILKKIQIFYYKSLPYPHVLKSNKTAFHGYPYYTFQIIRKKSKNYEL